MSTAKYDSYVICTSPRSGSTLLCKLLSATGVAGKPESYFHHPSVSDWLAYLGLSPDASTPEPVILDNVFRTVIARGTLDTGVFGLRLQRHSFEYFSEKLAVLHPECSSDLLRFLAAFGRTLFVHLTREDKVEQAVSYAKAQQSGLWHKAPDGSELERLSPPQEIRYDADEIQARMDEMKAMESAWTSWFARERIHPLRLTYNALSADPIRTLQDLLTCLGLDPDAARGVEPGVAKLSDETSHDWVMRFRDERGGTWAEG